MFGKTLSWAIVSLLGRVAIGSKGRATIISGPTETAEPRPLHAKRVFFILLRTTGHMTPYIHGFKALLKCMT